MFNIFGKAKKPLKGYKVTTVDRRQKHGIAADSLKMLLEKASAKLNIDKCRAYLARDGTEVQDEAYFETIEPQTLFVIASNAVTVKTDFQLMYETVRKMQANVFDAAEIIKNFVSDNRSEFDKFLRDLQEKTQQTKVTASNRADHEDWFEGVPSSLTTKEEVMARRSQDRIRGYFYKTKEEFSKSEIYRTNKRCRELLDTTLNTFQYFLIGVDYFSSLFNRKWKQRHKRVYDGEDSLDGPPRKRAKESIQKAFVDTKICNHFCVSLCNELGEFRCYGIWSDDVCKYETHLINPYASRENVILFQVWNLDHQIEITRTIIPSILADAKRIAIDAAMCEKHKRTAKSVSIIKYFKELFTVDNLRLVHIVCHDKAAHPLKSNGTIICDHCPEFKALQEILRKIDKSSTSVNNKEHKKELISLLPAD